MNVGGILVSKKYTNYLTACDRNYSFLIAIKDGIYITYKPTRNDSLIYWLYYKVA